MNTDKLGWKTKWIIEKRYTGQFNPFEIVTHDGNLALTEGLAVVGDLIAGLGSPTAFDEGSSYLGVGDSSTAADPAQTGLQAATNKFYQPMDGGFPSRSGSTLTYRATFADGDAEFDWRELTIANGSSNSADNLNRKVASTGTKSAGMVWTLIMEIVLG